MKNIVLDTNVLISGIINPFGPPGRVVDFIRSGKLSLVIDDRIASEYADVLHRPRLQEWIRPEEAQHIMNFILKSSVYAVSNHSFSNLPDPDDAPFLEMACTATVPLVSGNIKHFPEELRYGVQVYTPAEFIGKLFD